MTDKRVQAALQRGEAILRRAEPLLSAEAEACGVEDSPGGWLWILDRLRPTDEVIAGFELLRSAVVLRLIDAEEGALP
jgi:hypothetical protein